MVSDQRYDCALIGGGLAGLALSIQLANMGFKVLLLEKESYPFHKVCGEYVSLESFHFLEELGLPLRAWNLPVMKRLMISGSKGTALEQALPLGGFGLSRYTLDGALAEVATQSGVKVLQQTKVNHVRYTAPVFHIETNNATFEAAVCCATFGKRSNLDVKWKRNFTQTKAGRLNNFIGVKYHVLANHPTDMIALHNFHQGYCGISAIEDHKYCICYLTTASNLHSNHNDIKSMEETVLYKNPYLEELFTTATFLYKEPLTISQISFNEKKQVENHILMIGDAAGMITPLCGNGMSMALQGSKIAASLIIDFLQGKIPRSDVESGYQQQWNLAFHQRLRTGRIIQSLFGHEKLTNMLIRSIRPFPALARQIVRQTHGQVF